MLWCPVSRSEVIGMDMGYADLAALHPRSV